MSYKYIQTSNGTNQTESTDSNGITVYSWDATEVITSNIVYAKEWTQFQIETVGTTGGGNLKAQVSLDNSTWTDATDAQGNAITYSTATVINEFLAMPIKGLVRFSHDGNNTAGTIKIKVFL